MLLSRQKRVQCAAQSWLAEGSGSDPAGVHANGSDRGVLQVACSLTLRDRMRIQPNPTQPSATL